MRILFGYSYYKSQVDVRNRVNAWLSRARKQGIDIDSFCLTINPPGPPVLWPALDRVWQRGDLALLNMYEELARRLEDYDVFVNWNGINLHPDFVQQLTTITIFGCFDDPESSEFLSKPVAHAYDLCMVGNIAEVESYKTWGAKAVKFWPLGFRMNDYDPNLTAFDILTGKRDVNVTLLCERQSDWRQTRLDRYVSEFPDGEYYGRGWPRGFLAESKRVSLLQRTKIGINFHNSTGPINSRTYYLPANGILQICDNKSQLGKIFELNKEVVGFNTVNEAIELTHYYLENEEERRKIAAAGWARAIRDYNEIAVLQKIEQAVEELSLQRRDQTDNDIFIILKKKRMANLIDLFRRLQRWVKELFNLA